MEILERENEVELEENQIDFDFLSTEKPQKETKMQPLWSSKNTLVVLVRTNGHFTTKYDICGKEMWQWVAMATCSCQQKIVAESEDLLFEIKQFVGEFENVAVFFDDTPLLKTNTFMQIMNYFVKEDLNYLVLSRGYVFKAKFLNDLKFLPSQNPTNFGEEDFLIIRDEQTLSFAYSVLTKRILDYHKDNGVVLFGENSIFIDADVQIEKGCTIYPNNILKGETYIGQNVVLESGNLIKNSIVCDGVTTVASYIENSKIETKKQIGPFEKVVNQKI
jgi:bifunctional N-acetylglucosamine-1-phosphate-uridyltransferase/glucosamine-1-phosphate-acetyltransferase GlmU-like protein